MTFSSSPSSIQTHESLSRIPFPFARPGLDPSSWNGALLAGAQGSLWGIRVDYVEGDRLIARQAFYDSVHQVGPYAPDGSFARIGAGPLSISWARDGENAIVGCVTASREDVIVILESYAPYDTAQHRTMENMDDYERRYFEGNPPIYSPCEFTAGPRGSIIGQAPGLETIPGEMCVTGGWAEIKDRSLRIRTPDEGLDHFRLDAFLPPENEGVGSPAQALGLTIQGKPSAVADRKAFMTFRIGTRDILMFRAAVASQPIADSPMHAAAMRAAELLYHSEKHYEATKRCGTGPLGEVTEPLLSDALWMLTYNPYEKRTWMPPGRPWLGVVMNVWGWDENFGGLIASAVSETVANDALLLARGDERVGPLCVWKVYSKFKNKALLEACYPIYKKLYPTNNTDLVKGRPGNPDVGKGMDDTPMREQGGSEMYSLDMSCMKAWSFEILSKIAAILGDGAASNEYGAGYEILKKNINDQCWNDEAGIYRNRYIDGNWPKVESPTSFYPWLAGVPSEKQSRRLLKHLLDPKKFWGRFVTPTLAKDDPEYGKMSFRKHMGLDWEPYAYWRGNIWPPSNYMVYLGLKRYGIDDVAGDFAQKSVDLWMQNWRRHNWSCENYNPENGARAFMASHIHYIWGALLPLCGAEELIDVDMWSDEMGLRFGSLAPSSNTQFRVPLHNHLYDLKTNHRETILWQDEHMVFRCEGGRCVVRNFVMEPGGCRFLIQSEHPLHVEIHPPASARMIAFRVEPTHHEVIVNGEEVVVK